MRRAALILLSILLLAPWMQASASMAPRARVLVFTKNTGWRHDSIPAAVAALQRLGAQEGMQVDHGEDAQDFNAKRLERYQVVVFANTTLDVLTACAMRRESGRTAEAAKENARRGRAFEPGTRDDQCTAGSSLRNASLRSMAPVLSRSLLV